MFDDIKAPNNWNPHLGKHRPMRSLRLRGQSLDAARDRLTGATTGGSTVVAALPEPSILTGLKNHRPAKKYRLVVWWKSLNRNVRFAIISLLLLFFGVFSILFYNHNRPTAQPYSSITRQPKPVVKTVASPLSGIQVDPELAKRPVTGIMIENSPDARPQSGLQDAGVVFEAIAEGGITRFLTLYQENRPQYIGPVRSLRPYYIDWATGFDAPIAHVGGSPDALAQIRNGGKDLDQFFNAGSYWREPSKAAPHNVYTSFDKMDALTTAKGYTSSKFNPWLRKKDIPLATPTARSIDLNISSALFNVHYDYDKASNTYFRFEGGASHKFVTSSGDKAGGQLHPKIVIALVMNYSIAGDRIHSQYSVYGSGTAFVFQDGGMIQGTWNKSDRASQITFVDSAGQPIKLDAGQTWVSVVSSPDKVIYKP